MVDRASEVSLKDFLRYFPYAPAALAVKECARLAHLRNYHCDGPILDVGCGDGLFASIAFGSAEIWGIDIDASVGRGAMSRRAYDQVILGDITSARLPEGFFATCVANCSLEHVPRIDLALKTIRQCLRPGARAFLFVPDRRWVSHMLSAAALKGVGLGVFAEVLEDAVNQVFKHHHLYDAEGWTKVVADSGLVVEEVRPVLSTATTVAFEALLLPSLAGWLNKHLTGRWTNFPGARRVLAYPAYAAVRLILDSADQAPTAEHLVVARR
jgi:SAM-dependent methyltransferase